MIKKPTPVALAMFVNSFRSGFVHFFTKWTESFANCFNGWIKTSLNPSFSIFRNFSVARQDVRKKLEALQEGDAWQYIRFSEWNNNPSKEWNISKAAQAPIQHIVDPSKTFIHFMETWSSFVIRPISWLLVRFLFEFAKAMGWSSTSHTWFDLRYLILFASQHTYTRYWINELWSFGRCTAFPVHGNW